LYFLEGSVYTITRINNRRKRIEPLGNLVVVKKLRLLKLGEQFENILGI